MSLWRNQCYPNIHASNRGDDRAFWRFLEVRRVIRHSPGTLGTCFSGAPDTIRTRDRCLLGLARNPSPAPAIELAVLDANSHADYRQRGSLQLFSSLNTASTRSLPQILLPAFLGCSRKA